jgi:hypothetical protein
MLAIDKTSKLTPDNKNVMRDDDEIMEENS